MVDRRRTIAALLATIAAGALLTAAMSTARAATPPPDPGPTPYPTRVVKRQAYRWVRALFPREHIVGGACYLKHATRVDQQTYDCWVDVYDPDEDADLSHGFFDCRRNARIRKHALRVRVPETASVLIGRNIHYPGGVRCGHELAAVGAYRRSAS